MLIRKSRSPIGAPDRKSRARPPVFHQPMNLSFGGVDIKKFRSKNLLQSALAGTTDVGTLSETWGLTALGGCSAERRAKSDRGWSASIAVLSRLRPRARWQRTALTESSIASATCS